MQSVENYLASLQIGIADIYRETNPCTERIYIAFRDATGAAKLKRKLNEVKSVLGAPDAVFTEVIPGRPLTASVEFNNNSTDILRHESLPDFKQFPGHLPVVVGVDSYNQPLYFDLASCPHLLIAGVTGQGKSVCLHTILKSLVAQECELFIIDPKQSELLDFKEYTGRTNKYFRRGEAYSHTVKGAIGGLMTLEKEIRERNLLFTSKNVKNIEEYNEISEKKLERDVFVCDEFGDLSTNKDVTRTIHYVSDGYKEKSVIVKTTRGQEFQHLVKRVAMIGRSAGIHLVLSTQRPSAQIVDGDIKANFPTRIAFRMVTGTDSRVVLDTNGAQNLKGRGDAIFMDASGYRRFQCAMI